MCSLLDQADAFPFAVFKGWRLRSGAALSDSLNGGAEKAGLGDAMRVKPAIEAVGLVSAAFELAQGGVLGS